jgi:DNA polymerase III alpha subunit (gram-positive type)
MKKLDKLLKEQLKFPESKNLQQRGIADKIEDECNRLIKENFNKVVDPRSRRSIEDISIGNTYVDHKTSDEALKFKMPNLISIDRLRKLDRELVYNFVIYNSEAKKIVKTFTLDVYELNWDHLAIQNLGKGQLQITNMVEFLKSPKSTQTKDQWIATLQSKAIQFYEKVQKDALKRQKEWEKI